MLLPIITKRRKYTLYHDHDTTVNYCYTTTDGTQLAPVKRKANVKQDGRLLRKKMASGLEYWYYYC